MATTAMPPRRGQPKHNVAEQMKLLVAAAAAPAIIVACLGVLFLKIADQHTVNAVPADGKRVAAQVTLHEGCACAALHAAHNYTLANLAGAAVILTFTSLIVAERAGFVFSGPLARSHPCAVHASRPRCTQVTHYAAAQLSHDLCL